MVYERFERWAEWTGDSQARLGERLGCSQTHISKVLSRKRALGLKSAYQLESESADWPEGPITVAEWASRESSSLPSTVVPTAAPVEASK